MRYLTARIYEGVLHLDIPTVRDIAQVYELASATHPDVASDITSDRAIPPVTNGDIGVGKVIIVISHIAQGGWLISHDLKYTRVEGGWQRPSPLPDQVIWQAQDGSRMQVCP